MTIAARLTGLAALGAVLLALGPRADEPLTALRELPSPALPGAGQQNLAVGPDGRIYLSWVDRLPDSSTALRFAALGNSWSAPRTVAQGRNWFINWADFPSLAAGRQALVAHWLQKDGAGRYSYGVRLSRSVDGGATWSAPLTPHRDSTATEHGFVTLYPDASGGTGVIWIDGRRTASPDTARHAMTLRTTTLRSDGRLAEDVELDDRICDCCQTSAAQTSEGPVVVYRDRTAGEVRDIGIVRRVNGTWTAPAIVAPDEWHINACPVNGPMVAADGRRVAVAWFTGAAERRRVRLAFSSDAGATFGEPLAVDDGRPVGRVAVLLLPGGDALVSWLEDTGASGAEVRVRRVTAAGAAGPSMAVAATASGRPSGFPRMVRTGDRIMFAWGDPATPGGPQVRTAVARLAR